MLPFMETTHLQRTNTMNQKYPVKLSEAERSQLRQLISSGTAPARKLRRAQILLKSDGSTEGAN